MLNNSNNKKYSQSAKKTKQKTFNIDVSLNTKHDSIFIAKKDTITLYLSSAWKLSRFSALKMLYVVYLLN